MVGTYVYMALPSFFPSPILLSLEGLYICSTSNFLELLLGGDTMYSVCQKKKSPRARYLGSKMNAECSVYHFIKKMVELESHHSRVALQLIV